MCDSAISSCSQIVHFGEGDVASGAVIDRSPKVHSCELTSLSVAASA